MPLVEIISFLGSTVFAQDYTVTNKAVHTIAKAEGCHRVYRGRDAVDGKTAFLAVEWDTFEAWEAFVQSLAYTRIIRTMYTAIATPVQKYFVYFNEDPWEGVFEAPVTELTKHTLREGRTAEEMEAALTGLGGLVWGPVRDMEGVYGGAVGWESVSEHEEKKKESSELSRVGWNESVLVEFKRVVIG